MEALSATDRKVIRCVEYYFGDFNLPRDRHLQELIKKGEDGWVMLEDMLKFNRLRSLSTDMTHICNVLRQSPSDLLEISEDNTKIKRSRPLPVDSKEHRQEVMSRSVYLKGFPSDATFDEISDFLEEFGVTENIFMKRNKEEKGPDGKPIFKGSVFVLYAKLDNAKALVEKTDLKFKDQLLTIMFKADHFKVKDEERKKRKAKNAENGNKEKQEAEEEEPITKNAVLLIEGVNDELSREDLKTYFNDFGVVSWIQYSMGDDKAYVRFKEEDMATKALEQAKANEEEMKINDITITASVITGEEEEKYWQQMREDQKKRRENLRKSHGPRGQKGSRKRTWRSGGKDSENGGGSAKRSRKE